MATRVIDDTKLQSIATAIQAKDNGGQMTVDEMPTRIANIPTGAPVVLNPALVLWDWEGTKLTEYPAEGALALTELPAPSTLPAYATADHELLLFQGWNWSLANIKTWIQNHEGECLNVGAVYTTTDGQDHNYWGSSRLSSANAINAQKRGTTSVTTEAFRQYFSLAKLNIPNGTAGISAYGFSQCHSLRHVVLPDGFTDIGNGAFNGCYGLERVSIPNGVTNIGNSAFSNCVSLTEINVPHSVTNIDRTAFYACYSLKRADMRGCGITNISDGQFSNCYALTEVAIPSGVGNIFSSAFVNCYSLIKINLPEGLRLVDHSAFNGCCSLTKIHLPSSVTSIGRGVFSSCGKLCDILMESKPSLSDTNAFSGVFLSYKIYVPRDNLSWFATATNWSTIYTQGHFVAIEDYIDYLESIGFNVDAYKEGVA